jgi:hypothetical protein
VRLLEVLVELVHSATPLVMALLHPGQKFIEYRIVKARFLEALSRLLVI